MPPSPRMTLTVAAVARRLGVAPATLRTWDRRYGLGPSQHTAGAHRRYSSTDLARLVVMRRLTLEGVAPAEAASLAATTAVADGGFAIASASTIPAAVVQAAVTDAAAIAGPVDGLHPAAGAGLAAGEDLAGAPTGEASGTGPDGGATAPHPPDLPAAPREDLPEDEGEDLESARAPRDDGDWAVLSLAERFSEELATRGAAVAWDRVLSPALATEDAAMHEAVSRALAALLSRVARPPGERDVLVAALDAGPRGALPLAVSAALAEAGVGSRAVGDAVPPRLLAAAARRSRPPAVLVHCARDGARAAAQLRELLAVRPAPLVVLHGAGWPERVAGCERATSLHQAVEVCAAAVQA